MKKIPVIVIIGGLLIAGCNESGRTETTRTDTPVEEEVSNTPASTLKDPRIDTTIPREQALTFLSRYNEKYPAETDLFEREEFTMRLKKLLGPERYKFLRETWAVESPVKVIDDVFTAEACQAHNCGSTNFIIAYDLKRDRMYAGIREEDRAQTFSEDETTLTQVQDWEKGN